MFRISRIKSLSIIDVTFNRNKERIPKIEEHIEVVNAKPLVNLELKFTEPALYRLYDDYDDDMIKSNGDGTYSLEIDFPEDEWVYGYILSFGDYVEVIKPLHIRKIIKEKIIKINEIYK